MIVDLRRLRSLPAKHFGVSDAGLSSPVKKRALNPHTGAEGDSARPVH